jgi:hypothetical protein
MIDVQAQKRSEPPNEFLSKSFEEVANLLEMQGANPFRIAAYRTAAETIRQLDTPVQTLFEREGLAGLRKLRGIGKSLASSLGQLLDTGRLALLERLRGEDQVERVFSTVPDIGPGLARRIHEHLGIETLPELQAAATDGRLAKVPGMGTKRIRAVRESLAGRFRQTPQSSFPRHPAASTAAEVSVAELLDVDAEYRRAAEAGELPRIAPRRFNPTGAAWLPILHTHRGDRHYTAIFSNTARAHDMAAIHDWVVLYRDDQSDDGRWTVITSQFGNLRGRRIIRGRESECATYYEQQAALDQQDTEADGR